MSRTLRIGSDAETLQADLYGELPARRAAILVHGARWDGSGWREIAPRFVARGVPVLALNLRGYDGSTGKTDAYVPGRPWSPATDLAAAKAALREQGAAEIALVGASFGGHAVLASSFDGDVECVVSISAPVQETPDALSRRVTGRKLFVCADQDTLGAWPHVLRAFAAAATPKTLLAFGGREHSRAMFAAPYGDEAIAAIVDFVARGR
ncbi:MAG TPA: alpha/beta fold hydrolase [Candidatus Limnocylindria bacterium]|nr:alpha/beta fold hydrolase [Candidatus Limnocylindria bacterium]